MSKIDFKKFLSVFIKEADDDKDFMSAIKKALNDQGFIYDGEKIKKFKVVKGTCYKCIKDVVMSDGTVAYVKGSTYFSEADTCITDEDGNTQHYWVSASDLFEFFVPDYTIDFIQRVKEGEVIALSEGPGPNKWLIMFKNIAKDSIYEYFSYCVTTDEFYVGNEIGWGSYSGVIDARIANEEERKLLFDKLFSNGFYWDSEKMELIDRTLRNRAKQDKKEKHVWEDGDIVRLKEDNGKRWRIMKLEDGVLYRDAWVFSEMSEKYIAGGVIYTSGLDSEYEFVSNPTKDTEEVLEKSISEIDKMVPSYLEGVFDGKKTANNELLDNFNQNKIDNMVHHFKNTKENFLDKRVSDIYRKGITDTLEKLRKEIQ